MEKQKQRESLEDDEDVQEKNVHKAHVKEKFNPAKGEKEHTAKKEVDAEKKEDINYIVRVADTDVNGQKIIKHALRKIKGMNHRLSYAVAKIFHNKTNIDENIKIGKLEEEKIEILEDIIRNPVKHNVPVWMFNRRKDVGKGTDSHLTANDLAFTLMSDIKRMSKSKSYKGLRHIAGLKLRGQRTKSTGRKGGIVGVQKKDTTKKQ